MGIKDEIERQRKQTAAAGQDDPFKGLFDGRRDNDKIQTQLHPLVKKLEAQREAEYRDVGNFVFDSTSSAWMVRFPGLWSKDDPRRASRLPAITSADSPWRRRTEETALGTKAASNHYDTKTGRYALQIVDTDQIKLSEERLITDETSPKSFFVQERLDEIGTYGDAESAFEAFFPIYAREIADATLNSDKYEAIGAEIDAWVAARAQAAKPKSQAPDETSNGVTAIVPCSNCGQKNRIKNAPPGATVEAMCGKCGTPFRVGHQTNLAAQAKLGAGTGVSWLVISISILIGLAVAAVTLFFLSGSM